MSSNVALVAPNAESIMTGRSLFAGTTRGRDAIIAMRRQMSELTGGTWRAPRDDSYDIVSSGYHVTVIDRYLGERNGKQLDSQESILVHVEEGKSSAFLHYFFDQHAFDKFST